MSLLDQLPHRCTIRRRVRTIDVLGGAKDTLETVATDVPCWEQAAGSGEIEEHRQRGQVVTHKVYFTTDYGFDERYQIEITSRNGESVDEEPSEVVEVAEPDASMAFGIVYRVFVRRYTGELGP